ncbi:alpha/beta hydrolase [Rhodococcus sp. X156]|uniref:alpha/beta fold hydrolase n=1 Tax=Rhodococcus sp. X156 TaxID=2499145 RepID=UPI000FD9B770|nr:alpha/beta hydrolase [Rhodococcus sp. X156]
MSPLDPSSVRIEGPWTHRDVHANGIRFHVAEVDGRDGSGPLVLLLHGFPEFWWSWRHQLTGLAEQGARVVAVDLRGYGDSDKPPRGYDGWTLAGDVAGLIRALGETSAVLVGHDWGGLIAWSTATLHSRLVRGLAVLGAPHPVALRRALRSGGAQAKALRHAAGYQLPRWPERTLPADDAAAIGRVLRKWSGPDWAASPEFAEVARCNQQAMQVPGVVHSAMEYYRWAMRSQLRSDGHRFSVELDRPLTIPVLQLHGELDPCLLPATAAASGPWAPYRDYHLLPGVGHFVHQEAPERTNALLAGFLQRLP